jgi:hypothetical protein
MPPTKYGLLTNPIRLEPENINWLSRYQVILEKNMLWDEEKLCSEIIKELSHSNYIAVVVNTIKDCVIKKLQLPFDDNYEKYAVFVPKQNYIDKKSQKLMEYFKIHTLQELYHYYKDKNWMKDIDFLLAKRFMGILSKFTVI